MFRFLRYKKEPSALRVPLPFDRLREQLQLVMPFAAPSSSSWQPPLSAFAASLRSFVPHSLRSAATHPPAAVFGSPAGRFGLRFCHPFCPGTLAPPENKKAARTWLQAVAANRFRASSFRLRHPRSTRRRLALRSPRSSRKPFVPHFLQLPPRR